MPGIAPDKLPPWLDNPVGRWVDFALRNFQHYMTDFTVHPSSEGEIGSGIHGSRWFVKDKNTIYIPIYKNIPIAKRTTYTFTPTSWPKKLPKNYYYHGHGNIFTSGKEPVTSPVSTHSIIQVPSKKLANTTKEIIYTLEPPTKLPTAPATGRGATHIR